MVILHTRSLLVGEIAAANGVDFMDRPMEEDHGAEEDRKVQPTSASRHPASFTVL